MTVFILSDAEEDLVNGYWFYERQSLGLGDYFRSFLIADIDSLACYGGIHACKFDHHRALSKRFPFCIYYRINGILSTVMAVLDARCDLLWVRQRLEPS